MQISHFNREKTGLFTEISNRLSYQQDTLLPYIHLPFSKESFHKQIEVKSKNYTDKNRCALYETLAKQYGNIVTDQKVRHNIESLKNSNTFTITTGHQLSLFTGPIYFIYKILHTIRLTEDLKKIYPEKYFVPIFWMASEDHDFEEVQSVQLFNKVLKWETIQSGPVGRFDLENFEQIKVEFSTFFSNHPESEVLEIIQSYQGNSFADATFRLVNSLFQKYGLVILNGDDATLKTLFSPIIEKEITSQFSFNAVEKTSQKLQREGVKLQITPREINLFYLENGLRERIQLINNKFIIKNKGEFTKNEILEELKINPSAFSPNVVLRPLYQEFILPNLCYVGGGGEIAYWLQLKGVFDEVECTYPLIQVRNSLLIIDNHSLKKIEKLSFSIQDLFRTTEDLKKTYILANSEDDLSFKQIDDSFQQLTTVITDHSMKVNPNLASFVDAELTRMEKQLFIIKQKMIKSEKSKHEQGLTQIEHLKNKLFPNDGLQERSMNFFSLCADGNVYTHLDEIYQSIFPFENDLIVTY